MSSLDSVLLGETSKYVQNLPLDCQSARVENLTPNQLVGTDENKQLVSVDYYSLVKPYACYRILDALLPQGVGEFYNGVFPAALFGSGETRTLGFVNNLEDNLIKLDEASGGKSGLYLVNFVLSLACDNVVDGTNFNYGEIAILKVNPTVGNTIYCRQGIGSNAMQTRPSTPIGPTSRYNNIAGCFIVPLEVGDDIGIQALNIQVANQYKYNLSFVITQL